MVKKAAQATPNELLSRARLERGWTQKDVADRIGAPLNLNVNRWERGTAKPSAYYVQKLCEVFGKSASELGLLPPRLEETSRNQPARELEAKRPWNVPFRRNPFFTGRTLLFEHLHEQLGSEHTATLCRIYALSGLGGIGKTQTTIEYAYRYRDDYRVILWARATSRETLIADFVVLAHLLGLVGQGAQDQMQAVATVKRWLEQNEGWLLILDNADDLSLLNDFLPTGSQGHVLLTTRSQATGKIAEGVAVEKMEVSEGVLLLLRRAKQLPLDAPLDAARWPLHAQAQAIVEELDGLPLALDQAGAYIEETGCSLVDYLTLYRRRRSTLLRRQSSIYADYPFTVASVWSLSFLRVEQVDPSAAELLRLCSFLEPDAIPEAMLTEGAAEVGPVLGQVLADSFLLNEAIQVLRRYSLIKRDPEAKLLNMHRLVQVMLKESLDEATKRQWAERAVRTVSRAFPEVSLDSWPRCELCLPHVQVCTDLVDEYHMSFPESAHLLHQAGCYLCARGLYEQAEPLLQRALAIREQALSPGHLDTISTLEELAGLYYRQGKYEQEEPLLKRVLAIRQQVLGPEHPAIADTLSELGSLYVTLGKYGQGEPLFQRSLIISEQQLGPEHPNTIRELNNLAILYRNQGKYEQAEPLLRRALAISEQLDPERFAWLLSQMARLLYLRGQYKQAEPLYQRALAMREDVLGAMHPETAICQHDLGVLYARLGKEEQAETLIQRALAIREQVLGPSHKRVAQSLHDLASLYQTQGRYEQAEALYQRALTIQEHKLGPEHPDTAQTLTNLGVLYAKLGKEEQAEALHQRALAISEQVLGPEHPDVATSLTNLANLYETQDKYAEAEPLYQRALRIREQALGPEHPDTANVREDYLKLLHTVQKQVQGRAHSSHET